MKALKKMAPTAILTSDIHLREDSPICRLDNFQETLARKLEWLRKLQRDHGDIPVLDAGDLFHQWKPSPALLAFAMEHLPKHFYTIPGNHDIPQHSMELFWKSGLNVLSISGYAQVLDVIRCEESFDKFSLYGIPWKEDLKLGLDYFREHSHLHSRLEKKVLLYHGVVYPGVAPWPGAEKEGCSGGTLLDKFHEFDLIVSGHYHKAFTIQSENGNRLLVNPGGITRMTADEVDRQPYVYLWYAKDNTIEAIPVPIEKGVISIDHAVTQREKSDRIEAFISRLSGEGVELGWSFEENLRRYMDQNDIRDAVQDIVWECVHGG